MLTNPCISFAFSCALVKSIWQINGLENFLIRKFPISLSTRFFHYIQFIAIPITEMIQKNIGTHERRRCKSIKRKVCVEAEYVPFDVFCEWHILYWLYFCFRLIILDLSIEYQCCCFFYQRLLIAQFSTTTYWYVLDATSYFFSISYLRARKTCSSCLPGFYLPGIWYRLTYSQDFSKKNSYWFISCSCVSPCFHIFFGKQITNR